MEQFSKFDEKDTAILLTTAVDPVKEFKSDKEREEEINKRMNIYKDVIDNYMKKTKVRLFIIESTGNEKLGEIYEKQDRIKYHTFKKKDSLFFNNIDNKSTSSFEAYSILTAYQKFNLGTYNKILKITGRYFVPNIEKIIDEFQEEPDIYVQNICDFPQKSQRSEVFGMKSNLCPGIMIEVIRQKALMERILFNLYFKHETNPDPPFKVQRISKIKLEKPVIRGGDGMSITEL